MNESTVSPHPTPDAPPLHWFAVRVAYCREMVLKDILDREHIENFIPMRYGMVMKGGKRVRKSGSRHTQPCLYPLHPQAHRCLEGSGRGESVCPFHHEP